MEILLIILEIVILITCLLGAIAYLTLAERKVMGSIQRRIGPNKVGIFGLLQPFSDGIKLLLKEAIIPVSSNKNLFIIAPMITLFLSILGWAVIPFGESLSLLDPRKGIKVVDMNIGILYILAISSLGPYKGLKE